jgi:voltage-gated potassium channel
MDALHQTLDRFIHHPVVELVLVLLILVSSGLIIAEYLVQPQGGAWLAMAIASEIFTGLFAVELSVRFLVARKKRRFFGRYWLDILALVPLVRPLRIYRVLRMARLFRAGLLLNRRLSIFRSAVHSTVQELVTLVSITASIVLVGGLLLYLGERRINPEMAELGHVLWFSIMSLVAGEPVGATPLTPLGQLLTLGLMLGGMTVFAMFVGTVSASMATRLSKGQGINEMDLDELTEHVIICGWNRSGPTVLQELFLRGAQENRAVVIITESEQLPDTVPMDHIRPELLYHHQGDYTRVEVLEEANVRQASVAILLTDRTVRRADQDQDARTVLAALTIEQLSPNIFTCAQLHDGANATLLRRHRVEEIVVGDWYTGVVLGNVSRNRGLVRVLHDILTVSSGNAFHKVQVPQRLHGLLVGPLYELLKREHDAILMSVEPAQGENAGMVMVNPPSDLVVAAGDTLVVVCRKPLTW